MATTQNDINMKITVDANQAEKSTANYKQTLKELKDQMVDLEISTNGLTDATDEQKQAYAQLQQQAAQITDALGDVSSRIRTSADDYATFNAALEGLKGGAAVAQGLVGTLDLLGISNTGVEQVVKTLMSLQGVMNSINTVQALFNKDSKIRIWLTQMMTTSTVAQTGATETATVAQRAMNVAMNAMPIMAIVSAAALLISALVSITDENKKAAKSTDDLTDSQKKLNDELNKNKLAREQQYQMVEQYYYALRGVAEGSEQEKKILEEVNGILGTNLRTRNQLQQVVFSEAKTLLELKERQKNYKAELEAGNLTQSRQKELLALIVETEIEESKVLETLKNKYKGVTEEKKKEEQATNDNKKAVEEEIEVWLTEEELIAKYVKETTEELKDPIINTFKDISQTLGESKSIIANYLTGQLKDYKQYSDKWVEASKLLLETQREIEIESYKQQYEDGKISWELYQSEKFRIEQEYAQKSKDLQTDITNHQKEEDVKRLEATQTRLEASAAILSTFSSFTTAMMDAELVAAEGNEKKQKEIKKKYATANAVMQIGKIGIDTALAIMGVWSAYGEIPFAGPIIAGVLSAAIGALGIANTAKAIAEKNNIMKAAKGAFVTGASHSEGGVMMELEGGEAVLNKKAMAIPQYRNLASAMNVATGGVAFPGTTTSTSIINRSDLQMIVSETVAAVTAIPVVVSEKSITNVQRKVGVIESRSRL